MKIRPLLFSTPMVKAVLNGSKNQTRRVQGLEKFNENPDWFRYDGVSNEENQPQFYEHYFETLDVYGEPTEKYTQVKSKVKPGDIFWVRETWQITDFLHPSDENYGYIYKASDNGREWESTEDWKWKPSIFMPKEACRIFLKVTGVRAERLQDISNEDAKNEGVKKRGNLYFDYMREIKGVSEETFFRELSPKISFMSLWTKINSVDSWKKNPWV